MNQETMYAAALQSLKGCGSRRLQALLDVCRSPRRAWEAVWDEDLRRRTGIPAKIFSQLRQERNVFDWDRFQHQLDFYGVRPLALWDDDYPAWLPFTAQPPLVLFCQGTMGRDSSSLAIVGSRKASPYGLNAAESLAAELAAQGFTIISGGARGIDTRAHRGALKGKGRTVVVAANGLDRTYPPCSGRSSTTAAPSFPNTPSASSRCPGISRPGTESSPAWRRRRSSSKRPCAAAP